MFSLPFWWRELLSYEKNILFISITGGLYCRWIYFKKDRSFCFEGLPKYLPEVLVAHKTGTLDRFQNDVGIVFTPLGDYAISVFSESDSVYGAEERIALISKSVYDYFSKKL
ncbi:serine hydrolase [Candidatus Microgenomates bacterium]|nr:serine hydrolase [Candidatus Microgenomates bacterium]